MSRFALARAVSSPGRALCLAGLAAGLLGLPACGSTVGAPMAESSPGSSGSSLEPLPDLGPDAVVCGEPEDTVRTDEETVGLAGCQVFRGRLSLGRGVTDLSPLASLRVLEGRLASPGYNSSLETLDGLEQLGSVGEFHFLGDGLRDLQGVRNLREVEGSFRLVDQENLTDLDGLERLRTTGQFEVSFTAVVDLNGLSGLEEVNGDLRITGNPELTGIDGLASLQHVTGDVYITSNPKVPSAHIDALLSRVEVGGEVHLD